MVRTKPRRGLRQVGETPDLHRSPPPEACGRVTDPERYRPLHVAALALVELLAVRVGTDEP